MKGISHYKVGILAAALFLVAPLAADAATLTLSPSSGSYEVGQEFSVNVLLNSEGTAIDGADIRYLRYNNSLLEVVDADASRSGTQIQAGSLMPVNTSNVVNAGAGTVAFSQVTSGNTTFTNSSPEVFATITFRVKTSGRAMLRIDHRPGNTTDANVAAGGQDVLNSVNSATFTLGTGVGQDDTIEQSAQSGQALEPVTAPLSNGSRGDQVLRLQKFLIAEGHLDARYDTGYFGSLTEAAVKRFQDAAGVTYGSTGYGLVGPKTRAAIQSVINSKYSGGGAPGVSNMAGDRAALMDELRQQLITLIKEVIQRLLERVAEMRAQ